MSTVDQIKSRLNITDVAQSYLKLEKAGVNFKACCPFHNEKTPSFFVSSSRNSWHCFGCGKGGDIFSFVMEIERVEFIEALKILAARAGVEIKKEDPRERNEKNRLLKIMEMAKDFYKTELQKNAAVLEYLENRGLEEKTVEDFELGFAPDGWRNIYDFFHQKGYSDSEIEKSGLIINKSQITNYKSQINSKHQIQNSKQNQYYDRFRSRIMFPVRDASGKTVAFAGRIFDYGHPMSVLRTSDVRNMAIAAKYINSPQTALYDKSKILFNYDKAKLEIAKQNFFVLVEGNMDAIMSHQAGVKNVVAVSGTALTNEHIKLLSRLAKKAVMSFDTDEAGINATGRGLSALLSSGIEVKIAKIIEKDPADAVKKDKKIWVEAVKEAKHIIDFYLSFLKEKYGMDKRAFISEVERIVFPYIALLANEMEKSFWIKEISASADVKEDAVWKQAEKFLSRSGRAAKRQQSYAGAPQNGQGTERKQKETKTDYLEERIISLLIFLSRQDGLNGELKESVKDEFNFFSERSGKFAALILTGAPLSEEFAKDAERLAFEAEIIYNQDGGKDDYLEKEIKDEIKNLLKLLQKERLRERREKISYEIKNLEEKAKKGVEDAQGLLLSKIKEFNEVSKKI